MNILIGIKVISIIAGIIFVPLLLCYVVSLGVGFFYTGYKKISNKNHIETLGVRLKVGKDGYCNLSPSQKNTMLDNLRTYREHLDKITSSTLSSQVLISIDYFIKKYPVAMKKLALGYYACPDNKKKNSFFFNIPEERRGQVIDNFYSTRNLDDIIYSKPFRIWLSNRVNKKLYTHSFFESLNQESTNVYGEVLEICGG